MFGFGLFSCFALLVVSVKVSSVVFSSWCGDNLTRCTFLNEVKHKDVKSVGRTPFNGNQRAKSELSV